MKSALGVVIGTCLLCVTSACSSDDSDDSSDGDGPEQASCTFPSDDGPTCVDYRGDMAFVDILRNSCTSGDGVLAEGDLCPTAGVSGICSDEGSNRSRLFYYDVSDGLDQLEAACTSGGGTWSTG
jgi:hypothetical protein